MPGTETPARRRIAFARINDRALGHAESILARWLPDGRRESSEWVALNPKRGDRHKGSFKVNLNSGRWGDFAAGASGGDFISLAAYLFAITQGEAAHRLADMLGIQAYE